MIISIYTESFYLIVDEELELFQTFVVLKTDFVLLNAITKEPFYLLLQKDGLPFYPLHFWSWSCDFFKQLSLCVVEKHQKVIGHIDDCRGVRFDEPALR
jgi:hypothetical protein